MFGYVTVPKGLLTENEYEVFTSYYCGVCKAMGRRASQISRLGLSYDVTFLAIVLSGVYGSSPETVYERCIVHPKKKRPCIKNDKITDYSASVGVLLSYLKLADDWHDEKSIKALVGMAVFRSGYRRIMRKYPEEIAAIKKQLDELSRLEKEKCKSIDKTADAFAKILEYLFVPEFVGDETVRRVLAWFGYNLGRWIYIVDAFNDIDEDIKNGSYNALVESGIMDKGSCAEMLETSLTFTLENMTSAFELMDFKRNKDIIGKIIYTSLKQKQRMILEGKKENAVCAAERGKNESI